MSCRVVLAAFNGMQFVIDHGLTLQEAHDVARKERIKHMNRFGGGSVITLSPTEWELSDNDRWISDHDGILYIEKEIE